MRSLPKVDPKPLTELSSTSKTKYENYLIHSSRDKGKDGSNDLWK